jgi:glycosyltransferase involved in cell wall biosynthesis
MPSNISVIICCYNSSRVIENTLEHLKKQRFEGIEWEIVLVDNNSNDETASVAAACWNREAINIPLRIVREPKPGLANARIKGVETTSYDVISFIDDDNLVPENWITFQAGIFDNKEIGILGCNSVGVFDSPPPAWYEINKYAFATGKLYEEDFLDITHDGAVFGAGMTLRKSIFQDLFASGWQPALSGRIGNKQAGGEDSELCQAARLMGYKIFYTNLISLGHYIMNERLTWDRLVKMTHGFGSADALILPFSITYDKYYKGKSLSFFLRKHWWFNYLGKKIMMFVRDPFSESRPYSQKIVIRARISSFCEAISRDRELFRECFKIADKLMQVRHNNQNL